MGDTCQGFFDTKNEQGLICTLGRYREKNPMRNRTKRLLPLSSQPDTTARSCMNSWAVHSPLIRLHGPQAMTMFARDASPPRLIGRLWSRFIRRFFVKSTGV